MTDNVVEPRTEAARALSRRLSNHGLDFDRSILAIEAEARNDTAEVERLRAVVNEAIVDLDLYHDGGTLSLAAIDGITHRLRAALSKGASE